MNCQILDLRFFENAGKFQLIADNSCAKYLFLGDPYYTIDNINFEDFSVNISTTNAYNKGNTSNVLGSPINGLFWEINELIAYNLPVNKGMIITTGTCAMPIKFRKKDKLIARFGEVGDVRKT